MREALDQLVRIHYSFFMTNPRFWYDSELRDSDRLIVVAASNLRHQLLLETSAAS